MKCVIWAFACVAAAWLVSPASAQSPPASKPNIIVILADDLGYADVGFNGCRDIPTPHIDSLARGGVRCSNAYVTHPFCSPSRAGLLAGRYQQRFGHENNPVYDPADDKSGLPLSETLLPQALHSAGYVSAAIGKWHLGAHRQFHPLNRGFDEFFGFLGGGHRYFPADLHGKAEYNTPLERNRQTINETDYITDAFSREAVSFIQRHKDQPFFLYLAYNAPHTPLEAPEKYLDRTRTIADKKRSTYGAMICAIDDGVGQVLRTLAELKLEQRTLVIFLSDNGGPTTSGASNLPLRGWKGSIFEGGIRVPFALQWKGTLAPDAIYNQTVSSLDIYATAVALSGAQLPPDRKLDGVNLIPFLKNENPAPPHDVLYWRANGGGKFAVRAGSLKLAQPDPAQIFLFDLSADLAEQNDLAASQSDSLDKLKKLRDEWNSQLVPPAFRGIESKKPDKQPKPAKH